MAVRSLLILSLHFACVGASGLAFTGLTITHTQGRKLQGPGPGPHPPGQSGTYSLGTFETIVDSSGNKLLNKSSSTKPVKCPTGMCRTSFGRGTHDQNRGIVTIFAMDGLLPTNGVLVELDAVTGDAVRHLLVKSAYLYGVEATGRKDCEYVAVAVGLDGKGVEDAPAVVCVSTGAATNTTQHITFDTKIDIISQLSRADWLVSSGPWSSHVWDAKTSTYHVLMYMDKVYQREIPASNVSQSVVASVNIDTRKAVMSDFSPQNCEWTENYPGKVAPRNPIVALAGVDSEGGLHAIAARSYKLRSLPDMSAIGRRSDLALVSLSLGEKPSVHYLFNITNAKAVEPDSWSAGFVVQSASGEYHAMVKDGGAPETSDEHTVFVKLSAKEKKEVGRWSYSEVSGNEVPWVFDVAAQPKPTRGTPPEPEFPSAFSAVRIILEAPTAHAPVQYGWEKRDYTKGLHATARSVDNKTTDETVSDSTKGAGWTVWRDYSTKEETSCKAFNYMAPPPQKYLENATFVRNFACPGPGGPAVAVGCDFWTGTYQTPMGGRQVTVAVLGSDHTQLVQMEWAGGNLKEYYPIKEWKSGSSDVKLPSDCPKPAQVLI